MAEMSRSGKQLNMLFIYIFSEVSLLYSYYSLHLEDVSILSLYFLNAKSNVGIADIERNSWATQGQS